MTQATNKRSFVRKTIRHGAQIRAADGVYVCSVINVSAGGAKLHIQGGGEPKPPATLHIEGYGDFPCEIVWTDRENVGVEFLEEVQIMGDVAMAMAAFGPDGD